MVFEQRQDGDNPTVAGGFIAECTGQEEDETVILRFSQGEPLDACENAFSKILAASAEDGDVQDVDANEDSEFDAEDAGESDRPCGIT